MDTIRECMARAKSESALAEQKKEVLKNANENFTGRLSCSKIKKSRREVDDILSTVPDYSIGGTLISERYMAKCPSKKVVGFNL